MNAWGLGLPAVEVDADTGAALAVPGAVGVPGQQAVWLGLIAAAVGQWQLENLRTRADVQVLLHTERREKEMKKKTKNRSSHRPETETRERWKKRER